MLVTAGTGNVPWSVVARVRLLGAWLVIAAIRAAAIAQTGPTTVPSVR